MSSAAEAMTVSLMVQLTCDDVNWAPVGLVFQAAGWIAARVMCSVCYYFPSFYLVPFAICEAANERLFAERRDPLTQRQQKLTFELWLVVSACQCTDAPVSD